MHRRFDPGALAGGAAVLAGSALVAATVSLAGPGGTVARAAADPPVWLTIRLSDSAGGKLASGATVTVTAAVSNPSTFTFTSVDFSGTTHTVTTSNDAHPSITFHLSTSAVSFVSNQGPYTCAASNGQPTCSNSNATAALAPGGAVTVPVVLSVIGLPGQAANASATVSGQTGVESNQASQAGSDSATDTATITNPSAYTNNAPASCFPGKVGSDQVVTNGPTLVPAVLQPRIPGPQTFRFTDGSVVVTVTVPPGALPGGTLLSLYRGDPACWNGVLSTTTSSSRTFVDGYAVGWAFSGTTSFSASASLTIQVSDSNAVSGNPVYKANRSGLDSTSTTTAGSQSWSVSFTDDPGFVLAQAAAAPSSSTPSSSTTTSTSAVTSISGPAAGGGPAAPAQPRSPVPLAAGMLLIVVGAGLVATRRRRRTA